MILDDLILLADERQELLDAVAHNCQCTGGQRAQDICAAHRWLADEEHAEESLKVLRRLVFNRRYLHQRWVQSEQAEWQQITESRSQSRL